MKVLVVDHGTVEIESLLGLLGGHSLEVVSAVEFGMSDVEERDLVVMVGDEDYRVTGYKSLFGRERNFVKDCQIPLIAIGWGFELVCEVFGAKLEQGHQVKGVVGLSLAKEGMFAGLEGAKVYVSGNWTVTRLPAVLVRLAGFDESAIMVKHRTRPIYGLGFHPEAGKADDGQEIFGRVIREVEAHLGDPDNWKG